MANPYQFNVNEMPTRNDVVSSGSSYDFTGQRQMNPMLAKARRGLQFGMTAYSPYENPAERDARARELLSGYGEALGRIGEMGASAGRSEWSRVRSGEGRGSETSLPINQLRLMGLQDRETPQYRTPSPAPAPSGFSPDYGNAPSQWSVGPGTTDPNWKKPIGAVGTYANTKFTPPPVGLKKSFMPEGNYGVNTYTGQQVNLDTHRSTPSPNFDLPSYKGSTSGGELQEYGDSGIIYGAGSEEAYRKANAPYNAYKDALRLGASEETAVRASQNILSSGSSGRTY